MTGSIYERQTRFAAAHKLKKELRGDPVSRAKKAKPSKKTDLKKLVKQLEKQGRVR